VVLEKIKSIEEWLVPRNISEVRYFMRLVGYYRSIVEGFSKFSHPITSFQKKGVRFEWNYDCERSVQQLMRLLKTTRILNNLDPNEDFIVCTNA
jgi:hypothetical protein